MCVIESRLPIHSMLNYGITLDSTVRSVKCQFTFAHLFEKASSNRSVIVSFIKKNPR